MNRILRPSGAGDVGDDASDADVRWLRERLRDDSTQTHLDDAGFSARVMQALPQRRPALPCLDAFALVLLLVLVGAALLPLADSLAQALTPIGHAFVSRFASAVAQPTLSGLLTLLAPLLALYLAATTLLED